MARSVTLTTLQNRVRRRATIEGATAFISDAEVTDYINEGIAELCDVMRSSYGQDYFLKSASFSTTSGTGTYALSTIATDFMAIRGLDVALGNNIVLSARPFMFNQRNRFKWYPGWVYSQPIYYRLEGTNLVMVPTPTGSFTVTLWYVPTPAILVSGGDTLDGVAGWEEYAVLWAAIRCLRKGDQPEMAAPLENDLVNMRARIESLAGNRDASEPEKVSDVNLINVDFEGGVD